MNIQIQNERNADINIRRCDSFSEYLVHIQADYIKMRDGWKEHSSQWEVYDLLVRELAKVEAANNHYGAAVIPSNRALATTIDPVHLKKN